MPYKALPRFMKQLRNTPTISNLALEFTILTAARSGETRFATWDEIDRVAAVWLIPPSRMKESREHRVPLSNRALEILDEAKRLAGPRQSDLVFPGARSNSPLSDMSLTMALRRVQNSKCTVHGFRSSFRDWAGDETEFPRELAEAALSHKVGNDTELAYRRSDALAKRRRLMDDWEKFLITTEHFPTAQLVSDSVS